jgi:hypothetical protein
MSNQPPVPRLLIKLWAIFSLILLVAMPVIIIVASRQDKSFGLYDSIFFGLWFGFFNAVCISAIVALAGRVIIWLLGLIFPKAPT